MKALLIIILFNKAVSTQVMTLPECGEVALTIEQTKPQGVRALCIPMETKRTP